MGSYEQTDRGLFVTLCFSQYLICHQLIAISTEKDSQAVEIIHDQDISSQDTLVSEIRIHAHMYVSIYQQTVRREKHILGSVHFIILFAFH